MLELYILSNRFQLSFYLLFHLLFYLHLSHVAFHLFLNLVLYSKKQNLGKILNGKNCEQCQIVVLIYFLSLSSKKFALRNSSFFLLSKDLLLCEQYSFSYFSKAFLLFLEKQYVLFFRI